MTEPKTEAPAPEAPADDVESLKGRLAAAEARAAESYDKALRAAAELENVRRRVERESANAQKYALERILGELITVADNLDLAMKAVAAESAEVRGHLDGLGLTHRQLWATLERYGVSLVDPQGQPFNPEFHEAVSMVEAAGVAPGHVVSVLQKGYKLHERLLRPAMVTVTKAVAQE
ncbi:MAG: nucleotide exchange factor GrpE [Gammaproteobacteria bacterium]